MSIHPAKILFGILTLTLLIPQPARADDLCETVDSIRPRAMYCDENWAFLPPAETCVQQYKQMVQKERARIEALLNNHMKAAAGPAQAVDFNTTAKVLATTVDELSYLIDYGKQVHTELEDYVYGLVPPIYSEEEANGDPKEMRKRFMQRECFSDPTGELEKMEATLRPDIEDLEKTKAKVQAMAKVTGTRETQIQANQPKAIVNGKVNGVSAAGRPVVVPSGTSARKSSTITGEVKQERLPSSKK